MDNNSDSNKHDAESIASSDKHSATHESDHSQSQSMTATPSTKPNGDKSSATRNSSNERSVLGIRIMTVLVLLAAAVATGTTLFLHLSDDEEDAFERDFAQIAEKTVHAFLVETREKLWHSRTLAGSIHETMRAGEMDKINLSMPLWETMTEETRWTGSAKVASWSPFLFNEDELKSFWGFAVESTNGGIPSPGSNPVCDLCGNLDWVVTNPDLVLTHPFFGDFSCKTFYNLGRAGALGSCQETIQFAKDCTCGPPTHGDNDVMYPTRTTSQGIWEIGPDGSAVDDTSSAPWNPMWATMAGDNGKATFLYNQMSEPVRQRVLDSIIKHRSPAFSEIFRREGAYYENYSKGTQDELAVLVAFPVFELGADNAIAGSVVLEIDWKESMPDKFPVNADLVNIVISNSCGQEYTFRVNKDSGMLDVIGEGDIHDRDFEKLVRSSKFTDFADLVTQAAKTNSDENDLDDDCLYRFLVYPTSDLYDEHVTNEPTALIVMVFAIFAFVALALLVCEMLVKRLRRSGME